MADEPSLLLQRIIRSVKGHLRVASIAVVFGLTAYGLIHLLLWAVNYVEKL